MDRFFCQSSPFKIHTMELRQLKYFVTVAQTRSFSEAARKLYITQGTLSQQIRQLEYELGSDVFQRNTHRVSLTEAGEELLPLAERTLLDAGQISTLMEELKTMATGTLNIGLTLTFRELLSSTLREFMKLHPGIQLRIYYKTASELIQMLLKREIDFALAYKPSQHYEGIESEVLFESDLSAILRKTHPLADRKILTFEDIDKYGVVLPASGLQSRKAFERFIDIDTSPLKVRMEINDPNIIMDMIQSSNLISILSGVAARYRENLTAIPLEGIQRTMLGCVHWLNDGYRKHSAETFIRLLRNSAQLRNIMMNS